MLSIRKASSAKIIAALLCVFLLAMVGAAAGCSSKSASSSNTIRLGMSAPITGSEATAGQDMVNGAQLAVADLNAAGGVMGKQVVLVPEDDACDPTQAVQAANKLVSENVVGVLGYYCSGACNPCLPILAKVNMPTVLVGVDATDLTHEGYTNIVRVSGYNAQGGPIFTTYIMNTLKATKVAVIQDGTASPRELAQVTVADLQKAGPSLQILTDQITPGEKDYSSTATKIAGFQPDAVVFTGFYAEGSLLLKQMRAAGVKCQYLCDDACTDQAFIQVAGADAEGTLMLSPRDSNDIPNAAAFSQKYKSKFNMPPGTYAALAYDAVNLLANAIKTANGTDPAAVVKALRSTNTTGITGAISFDANGDLTEAGYIWIQIKNGQFVKFNG